MIDAAWAAITITVGGGVLGALWRASAMLARLDERVAHLAAAVDKLEAMLESTLPRIAQRASEHEERLTEVALTVRELETAVSDTGSRPTKWGHRQ